MFLLSDMKVMRLVSLCWQLWSRHAVPHAPLSHVPAAWWAGGGRRDGEGAHSSHPWGSFFPCCRVLQSPVHSHSHPLTPGGDAADAPGCPRQPWTQVQQHDVKLSARRKLLKRKKILKKCIYSLKPHKEIWFTLHLKFMAVFLIGPIKLHVYRLYIVCTVGHFSKAHLRF